jgi:hypothetical protein
MGNNKTAKKCRRCNETALPGKRHCEYYSTHRKCVGCLRELHVSEFNDFSEKRFVYCNDCHYGFDKVLEDVNKIKEQLCSLNQ